MNKIKTYIDFIIAGLCLISQGLMYFLIRPDSLTYYFVILFVSFATLIRLILNGINQLNEEKKNAPDLKRKQRSNLDLVAKSKAITEDNQQKLAKFSSVFLQMKTLVSASDKKQILEIYMSLLKKNLDCSKATYFEFHQENETLISCYSTDMRVHDDKVIKVSLNEENFISYCGKKRQTIERGQIKQNLDIVHFNAEEPLPMYMCSPIVYNTDLIGVINISQMKSGGFSIEDKQFFATLCTILALTLNNAKHLSSVQDDLMDSRKNLEQKSLLNEKIKHLFGKFTSPKVVQSLVDNGANVELGGEEKELTVLFADIRSFTNYCEKREPQEVVDILNEYLTAMSKVIIKYDGTLDKYIGDEIMAFWGAPLYQKNNAKLATQACFEMLQELKKLHVKWERAGKEVFNIGLGLNTGPMIVGNIGSTIRMDFTVIGDAVNLGSRVQGLTRKFNSDMLITESTYSKVKDIVKARKIGALQVKGKEESVMIYAIDWVDLKPLI
ncbi:MAG: hypothetical protein COB02_06810 [Candidatus Cloacimonadota bacterium]|nr:MAG: hypothetical protein COB02_06810 [Candidatus Cloacimonadota bacterium]